MGGLGNGVGRIVDIADVDGCYSNNDQIDQ
jgi:hypothetical protein